MYNVWPKSTMETPNYGQCRHSDVIDFTHYSGVSIVYFEQVNASWAIANLKQI